MGEQQPWLSSEVGVVKCAAQASELCRRGFRRPVLTLLISGLVAAALAGFVVFRHRDYAPHFVLRVVEADRNTTSSPALKRQLAEYVRQAVFTSEPLLALMQKHDLYPTLRRNNARAAIDAFKEDISIDVYQNYFVEERRSGSAPRSVRLTVSFHAKDPNLALAVTRELGELIIRREQARRRDQALESANRAEQARDILVQALQRRSSEVLAKKRAIASSPTPDPRTQVELVGLLGSLEALSRQAESAEKRSAALDVGAALERRGIGLYFDVVDDGALPGRAAQLQSELWGVSAAILVAFPLIAMAVGATAQQRGQT
jgi:hypothetical protein